MGKLENQTALVTGAGRGIGAAIAQAFAREGARIAVTDIDLDSATATQETLPTDGLALRMDVSSQADVRAGFGQAINQMGHLDILVNNAGYIAFCTYDDCTEELWDRTININLKGTYLCTQAALAHMKERRSGQIVSMTSMAAKTGGLTVGPPYAASKGGIFSMIIGRAREGAPFGIRANGIAPGVIDTEMTRAPQYDDNLTTQIPLGEKGQPEDVAACALFLVSDDSRHITGEIVDVNGGLFMD